MKSTKKLKKIYHIFFEEYGEVDAFFTASGKLIDYWYGNDATWRHDYFAGLLQYMGYEVVFPTDKQRIKMVDVFKQELIASGQGYMLDDLDNEDEDIEA